MRVLEDKHNNSLFPREVRCKHCDSLLEVERGDCVLWYDDEAHKDVYAFICPCCNETNNPSPHSVLCSSSKVFKYMSFMFEDTIGSVGFRKEDGELKGIFTVYSDTLWLSSDVRKATQEEFEEYHRMKKSLDENLTNEEKEYLKKHGYL